MGGNQRNLDPRKNQSTVPGTVRTLTEKSVMAFRVLGPTTCGSLICLFRVDRQQYAFVRARPKHDLPFREPDTAVVDRR